MHGLSPDRDRFLLLLFFSFFFPLLRVIQFELVFFLVFKFAGKECQRTGIHFSSLTLMSPPSTYTPYCHLARSSKKSTGVKVSIKYFLKDQNSRLSSEKLRKVALLEMKKRLIFFMISHAHN